MIGTSLVLLLAGCASGTDRVPVERPGMRQPRDCATSSNVAVQVLGSGGPIADDARAGTGYLVWHDGRSRFLIDAGSGTMSRFGVAGGSFNDLDAVALSHFHVDHTSDLPALLKSGYFSRRTRALPLIGPGAGGPFPSLEQFLESLIGTSGAYGYLSGYLDGRGGLPQLARQTIDSAPDLPTTALRDDDAVLRALGVPHSIVPALAFRLEIDDTVVVFAGDQNGNRDSFIDFARGADVLVMHLVVPETITGAGRKLHAPPSRIGDIAAEAGAGTLVLSHFMARSLRDLATNVALVRDAFDGNVVLAKDLLCVPVTRRKR